MTYDEYVSTPVPRLADLPPVPADEPEGLCGKCGTLCRFTEEPYTGLATSTCCGALPARPRLLR